MSTGGDARWSESIDSLLAGGREFNTCDVLIVGSGYGGSFAARELASTAQVWVVERGREYALGEFPEDVGALPGHVRFHRRSKQEFTGDGDALFDVRMFDDLSVLVANGLGGGSLINAGVAFRPDRETLDSVRWPTRYRDRERQGELYQAMAEVEDALQAKHFASAPSLRKFQAFDEFSRRASLGKAEPVKVTIAEHDSVSPGGLQQNKCVKCGNCFTGCNEGSKNTLVSHVIPLAVRDGARFFTGGTALRVKPYEGPPMQTDAGRPVRWVVQFARTADFRGKPDRTDFELHAHTVILAAGTLGSTEVLLRSRDEGLGTSGLLGQKFSTNGDMIAMGWGMESRVDGISAPLATDTAPSDDVGPTILGFVRSEVDVNGGKRRVMFQDGAVPSALSQGAVALGTVLSFAHRYTENWEPTSIQAGPDMLATAPDIGRHALVLLGMGDDDETGQMSLPSDPKEFTRTVLRGKLNIKMPDKGFKNREVDYAWPDPKPRESLDRLYHQAVDKRLECAKEDGAFQGGDFLSNPLWRPFPTDFALIGGEPPNKLLTVHPLGGCAMGDDGCLGVVDWTGAVFKGEDETVHDGLHVLDGSILPGALGVNPFLTISALSLLAARRIRAQLERRRFAPVICPRRACPSEQPRVKKLPFQAGAPVQVVFEEYLQGEAEHVPDWLEKYLTLAKRQRVNPGPQRKREWIVRVTACIDLHAWLADPSMKHDATLELFHNTFTHEMSVQPEAVRVPLLRGSGRVSLLALDGPRDEDHHDRRMWSAVLTYALRRSTKDFQALSGGGFKWGKGFVGYFRAGRRHALRRVLSYDFDVESTVDGAKFKACGHKLLAFAPWKKNVWEALTELDLTLQPVSGDTPARLALKVDLVDLVRERRLQVKSSPNTPATMVALASFASLWLRAIFTTHFWTFRGSGVEFMDRLAPAEHLGLKPGGPLSKPVDPQRFRIPVRRSHKRGEGRTHIELTRYSPPDGKCTAHVLLIHGLAHGGSVFTTNTIDSDNMATAFLRDGYVVWVLDHRLSNRLGYAAELHTMDQVAEFDIRRAVRCVYRAAGNKPIRVFAHCVGAGAFAMAALKGWLGGPRSPWIESAILHAVHPWVVPSASNQLSAALAAFYKDFLEDDDRIDPLVPTSYPGETQKKRGFAEELIDRFGSSIPWDEKDLSEHERHKYHPHGGCAVCNRMTVFYGKEWLHGNLSDTTHERIGELVGEAGVEVFRQLFFIADRQRITDRDGANVYLTQDNIADFMTFPVLFCHGRDNKVFDPRSAVRSWHRLNRIRSFVADNDKDKEPAQPAKLFIRPGYGHMDFLFGKDAHKDIYPALIAFFNNPAAHQDEWRLKAESRNEPPEPPRPEDEELNDLNYLAPRAVPTGPMIQLERTGEDNRRLVLWFEQELLGASQPYEVEFHRVRDLADGTSLVPWQSRLLKTIQSNRSDRGPGATLRGAGAFWTAWLDQQAIPDFEALPVQELFLVSQQPHELHPETESDRLRAAAARSQQSKTPRPSERPDYSTKNLKDFLWHKAVERARQYQAEKLLLLQSRQVGAASLQFKPLGSTDKDLAPATRAWPAAAPADCKVADPAQAAGNGYDDNVAPVIDLAGYPWWRLWMDDPFEPFRARRVSWLASSCRWPGLPFERVAADRLAKQMTAHICASPPAEALVLLGDQIYTDATADVADTRELEERGAQRYRDAWGSPHTRKLLAALPTYLVVDDHEYKDGWAAGDQHWLSDDFRNGFEAAFAYQWRWREPEPKFPFIASDHVRGFWKEFRIGNLPAFAADTRSERRGKPWRDHDCAQLMSCEQRQALYKWLKANADIPKILCTGSVFGMPEHRWSIEPEAAVGADDWYAYPGEMKELLEVIVQARVRNLIFLSGDYHLSAVAELEIGRGTGSPVRALSVVSSGWNATLPFANKRGRELVAGRKVRLAMAAPEFEVTSEAKVLCTALRQFSKHTLEPVAGRWQLHTEVFAEDGRLLAHSYNFL